MGQKRVAVVDLSQEEKTRKVSQKKAAKQAGKTTKVVKSGKGDTGRLADKSEAPEDVKLEEKKQKQKKSHKPRERSRRYKLARSRVDRTKYYPIQEAIDLIKKTSIARFDGTISAHFNLKKENLSLETSFPHPTGKTTKVAIASDALIKKIKKKEIDFDILLATPKQMPEITKVAKILGPRGLMPNPKNNTITDDPQKRKKELESGVAQLKTENKAPIMHVVIGKTSLSSKKLEENLKTLIQAVDAKHIKKLTLASTMSPGVKVELAKFKAN